MSRLSACSALLQLVQPHNLTKMFYCDTKLTKHCRYITTEYKLHTLITKGNFYKCAPIYLAVKENLQINYNHIMT